MGNPAHIKVVVEDEVLENQLQAISSGSLQTFAASVLVEELVRLGVERFVVSPGARAIPLMMALEHVKVHHPDNLRVILCNDERASGFFAQGIGKAGSLAALICTSGTAAANYLPSIIEAYYSNIPLIVITCDRPWELQYSQANQTIHQKDLYSSFVGLCLEIPAPEISLCAHSFLSNVFQLVEYARKNKKPVHLNVCYRKPFYDSGFSFSNDLPKADSHCLRNWWIKKSSYIQASNTKKHRIESPSATLEVSNRRMDSHRVLLVVGPLGDTELERNLLEASAQRNVPVIADVNSQLRVEGARNVLSYFNLYINHSKLKAFEPEVVYYLGDRFISDQLYCYLDSLNCSIVRVSNDAVRKDSIENEFIMLNQVISEREFFEEHLSMLVASEPQFYEAFSDLEVEAERFCQDKLDQLFPEAACIKTAIESSKSETVVFLSPSLIFRQADFFLGKVRKGVRVYTNRGATGIDGVIASAIGSAYGSENHLICIVGDQTALHDLTSLGLLKNLMKSAVVLIINNGGGAIFNIINQPLIADSLVNGHAFNFEDFARGFGISYDSVDSIADVKSVIEYAQGNNEKVVLEFRTNGKNSAASLQSFDYFSTFLSISNS